MTAPSWLATLSRDEAANAARAAEMQQRALIDALRRELEMTRARVENEREHQAKFTERAEACQPAGCDEQIELQHVASIHGRRAAHAEQRLASIEAALKQALGVERKGWWHSWQQRVVEAQQRRRADELERDLARARARVDREAAAVAALRERVESAPSEAEGQAWALQIPPVQSRLDAAEGQLQEIAAACAEATKKEMSR